MKFTYNLTDPSKLEVEFGFTTPYFTEGGVTINWGDGNSNSVYVLNGDFEKISKTYLTTNEYVITVILGDNIIGCGNIYSNSGDNYLKGIEFLTKVEKETVDTFYNSTLLTSLQGIFAGASNLISVPNDLPLSVTNISYLFHNATSFNQDISSWNVSQVTNISGIFKSAISFNKSLNNWDVSNVTNMFGTFFGATSFNGNISGWNVSSVIDMSMMFRYATSFNGDISGWNVLNVSNMASMFYNAIIFDKSLNNWNVSSVTDMSFMFYGATIFNGNISNWKVSNVTDMGSMFEDAISFNKPLSSWDVTKVTDMYSMFRNAKEFDQPLNNWNLSSLQYIHSIFNDESNFNQDISSWVFPNVTDLSFMFYNATSFNQDLSNWDVSNIIYMNSMFYNAISFNQDLSNWDISNVTEMGIMFSGVKISTEYYSNMLLKWANSVTQDNIIFDGGLSNYNLTGQFARSSLINFRNWTITDGGLENNNNIPCLTENTKILTPKGYIEISQLNLGDNIITDDNRIVQIKKIYKTTVKGNKHTYPYIIPKNSIALNYPENEVKLSRDHLIKYNDKWIRPGDNFKRDMTQENITYYHIQLENYITDNLVINNGFIVESLASSSKDNIIERKKRGNNLIKVQIHKYI